MNNIDKYKITLNRFTAEISEPLDRELRTLITLEADIYDVSQPDNGDGTVNQVFKAKLVGTTIVKQGKTKVLVAKSKRSQSQIMRLEILKRNDSEEYYQRLMSKFINNLDGVIEFLKDK